MSIHPLIFPAVVTFVVHIVGFTLLRPHLRRAAKSLLVWTKGNEFCRKRKHRADLFASESFAYVTHLFFLYYGWTNFRSARWFQDPLMLGVLFPDHAVATREMTWYFGVLLGYYFYALGELFVRRLYVVPKAGGDDFVAMVAHHVLSITLLFVSYFGGYVPAGICVLHVHNLTDVFTFAARLASFVELSAQFVLLPCCMMAWIYLRLFRFPYYVLGAGVCGMRYLNPEDWSLSRHSLLGVFMTVGAVPFYCLHVYWVYIMLSAAVKVAMGEWVADDFN